MSRLFYHVMQDNLGNLLFDVSGTMRLAGTGTAATIYGDEALTIPIANPMTNHPSFGSFKCFLGAGDYDFYMAKSGYTFETLTGVQGLGTMAQQDASAVAITGGTAVLADLTSTGGVAAVGNISAAGNLTVNGDAGFGVAVNSLYRLATGSKPVYFGGGAVLGGSLALFDSQVAGYTMLMQFLHNGRHGLRIKPSDSDTGVYMPILFHNLADAGVGSISTTATATAYNTTSDARLKHAVTPLTGALDVVQALKPSSFRWNADDSAGVGFLAGEVQEVIPDGVITGERGAIDDAGNIVPQMIDYSKLVPWLVGCCKELAQQIEALTARLDAAGA